jgi:hypothetical protein
MSGKSVLMVWLGRFLRISWPSAIALLLVSGLGACGGSEPTGSASICGDGICSADETASTCPDDCGRCGDGICSAHETATSCPADCTRCGDGICSGNETVTSCPADCARCGDGICSSGETRVSCPKDCAVCGDGHCDASETSESCPKDCCDSSSLCGNKCLSGTETCCPDHQQWCSDGTCKPDSSYASGYACFCPSGESWCDKSCVPTTATCCNSGKGIYCETGTCVADSSASSGYLCRQPTGVCLYEEDMTTACGSGSPAAWYCDANSTTLSACKSNHSGSSSCAGGCCWVYHDYLHQIFIGTCAQALASKA